MRWSGVCVLAAISSILDLPFEAYIPAGTSLALRLSVPSIEDEVKVDYPNRTVF
jgi:hypothetical protein